MKRTVVDCDRCSAKELPDPVSVWITTGRSADPCEGMTDDCEQIELCSKCAAWAFGRIAKKLTYEDGVSLVREIRSKYK